MKTCRDCVNYAKCVENCNTYHASRLTPDSDVSDRCEHFEHKAAAVNTVVYCKDCKYYSVDNALLGNVCAKYIKRWLESEAKQNAESNKK